MCQYVYVGTLTACISVISLWYLIMVLLSFSFSALSSSSSFLFSFFLLYTWVSLPRSGNFRCITSASLFTAWEQSRAELWCLCVMNRNSVNSAGKPLRAQWFRPGFNTSLQLNIILSNKCCDITVI